MPHASYVEAAAADFGRHSKGGGGWALGLEVAACVKPGANNGRPRRRETSSITEVSKVSAEEFARQSGTSGDRVLRHLEAWERAAAKRLVAPAANLTPADWNDPEHVPEGYEWSDFYDARAADKGSRVSPDPVRAVAQVLEMHGTDAVVEALTPEQTDAVVHAAARRRPSVTRNAVARATAEDLPESPFTEPPQPYPGAADDGARMDIQRDVAHIHDAIGRVEYWTRTHREMVAPHADRLDSEAEQLHMVAEAARGLSDDTLVRILDGEDDLR